MTASLSQVQYAKHRGCSRRAVQKALESGRIFAGPDGRIDPVAADRDWAANTDLGYQRGWPSPSNPAHGDNDDAGEYIEQVEGHVTIVKMIDHDAAYDAAMNALYARIEATTTKLQAAIKIELKAACSDIANAMVTAFEKMDETRISVPDQLFAELISTISQKPKRRTKGTPT